jgi:hypothetical protein
MTNDVIVVGAPGYNSSAGAAYLFFRDGENWVASQKVESPDEHKAR